MKKNSVIKFLTIISLLFAVSCSSIPLSKTDEVKSLTQRVKKYMQAKSDNKWDIVYSLFDSSSKKNISKNQFISIPRNIIFKTFTIGDIQILNTGTEAVVRVKVNISIQQFDFKDAPEKQTWIKENGKWFIKIKNEKFNPIK